MIDPKSYDDIVRHLGGLIPCYERGQPGCILEDAANEHCGDGCLILSVYREGLRRGADEIERLREVLRQIADGETDGFAGDPSRWPSTAAGEAIGYEWRDGVRIPDALMARLDFLRKRVPACPECGGRDKGGVLQIQLTQSKAEPAIWRCRLCKTRFAHEPTKEPKDD